MGILALNHLSDLQPYYSTDNNSQTVVELPFAGVKFKACITYVCCAGFDYYYFFYNYQYGTVSTMCLFNNNHNSLQVLGTKQDIKTGV